MSRRNLILCGPPGVGKTTLGRLCAQQLGLSFVDTDEAVQQRTGKTAAQLLLSDGEAALRAAEAALVQELKSTTGTVIATGGGVVISAENRQHLHQLGPCVTLTATAAELLARLGTDAGQTRPLLAGPEPLQRLQQLLQNRAEAYAAQPFQLSTSGRSPAQLTQLLSTLWTANHSRITVNHPLGSYNLFISKDLLSIASIFIQQTKPTGGVFIISDSNVAPIYIDKLSLSLNESGFRVASYIIAAGESSKNLQTISNIYDDLAQQRFERGSAVLALGGGVVGDIAGFVAATYLRGVAFVQIPTSLLAMADSSIGGKVGVDLPAGKNLVGAFKQPALVLMDLSVLQTLPPEEISCGLAEILKAALISGDKDYAQIQSFAQQCLKVQQQQQLTASSAAKVALLAAFDGPLATEGILHAALRTKQALVQEDPEEHGRRALLNLGHTFGHGLETWSHYQLRHGGAVALGLLCAVRLSVALGLCSQELARQVLELVTALGLPTQLPASLLRQLPPPGAPLNHERFPTTTNAAENAGAPVSPGAETVAAIWQCMQGDKKRRAGTLRFVLLTAPGALQIHDFVDEKSVLAALATILPAVTVSDDIPVSHHAQ